VGDPYRTLFIARLSYEVTEEDLRREFEMYGQIERLRIIRDKKGKSRGYAFILYEREKDMKGYYYFPLFLFYLFSLSLSFLERFPPT
jgi:U1 small nuclear ribonucleoprotein